MATYKGDVIFHFLQMIRAHTYLQLLGSRHCSKHIIYLNSFHPHNDPIRTVYHLLFLYSTLVDTAAQEGLVTCPRSHRRWWDQIKPR